MRPPPSPPPSAEPAPLLPARLKAALAIAALLVAGAWTLGPALSGRWLWDDPSEVTENRILMAHGGPARLWMAPAGPDYFPLKDTVLWLEWRAFGADPAGYHAVSLALHLLSSVLFFWILVRLGAGRLAAWFGALFFAVHPLVVESVGWASELKNTLSLALLLGSALAYLRWDAAAPAAAGVSAGMGRESAGSRSSLPPPAGPHSDRSLPSPAGLQENHSAGLQESRSAGLQENRSAGLEADRPAGLQADNARLVYVLSLALFLLALLSKTSVVMFPCVLLLHAWWRRGRVGRRDLAASAPFFALSLILGLVTVRFQGHNAIGGWTIAAGSLAVRLEHAATAIGFYAAKAVFPDGLLPLYSRWEIGTEHRAYLIPAALVAAAAIAAGFRWRREGRTVLFGLGFFVLNLLPVSGLLAMSYFRYARVADHFAYLPLLGAAGLAAAGFAALDRRRGRPFAVGVAATAVALLAGESHAYVRVFHDSETLWSYAIARDPLSWAARYNFGRAEVDAGRLEAGRSAYEEALRLKPDLAELHNNLGYVLMLEGRLEPAGAELRRAVSLDPADARSRVNLGNYLARTGDLAGGIAEEAEAVRQSPTFVDAQIDLANLLARAGRLTEALDRYREAVALAPDSVEARFNWAITLLQAGRMTEAADQLAEATRLAPGNALVWGQRGAVLAEAGRYREAERCLVEAARLDPRSAEVEANLGQVLLHENRFAEAADRFELALRLEPTLAGARQGLEQARAAAR